MAWGSESYSFRLARDDIQSIKTEFKDVFDRAYSEDDDDIPEGSRMRLLESVETRSLVNSPTLVQENADVHFTTCLTCNHKHYGQYNVTVVVNLVDIVEPKIRYRYSFMEHLKELHSFPLDQTL